MRNSSVSLRELLAALRIRRKVERLKSKRRALLLAAHRINEKIYQIQPKRTNCKHIKVRSLHEVSETGRLDVKFENAPMRKVTGICFQVLRFVPPDTKRMLQQRGQWDDISQALYLSAIEYWRSCKGKTGTKISRRAYKKIVKIAGRNLRRTMSDLMPNPSRLYHEHSVANERLDTIPVGEMGRPTCIKDSFLPEIFKVASSGT